MDMCCYDEAVAFPNKKNNNNNNNNNKKKKKKKKKKKEIFRLCRHFKIMLKVMAKVCLRFQEFLA